MIKYVCDRCSAMIEEDRLRYTFRIELFAAYDIMKIRPKDVRPDRDIMKEIDDLIRKLENEDPEKLTEDVYYRIEQDLCPKCRRIVLAEIKGKYGKL